jgi:hypothetical protein
VGLSTLFFIGQLLRVICIISQPLLDVTLMKSIKHVISLLTGKSAPTVLPTDALSSSEMDHLFGGKPAEATSEHAYWWIEDEEASLLPKFDANSLSIPG